MQEANGEIKFIDEKTEDLSSKQDADAAAAEELTGSVLQTLRHNPKVVFWCLFFAFSAIGW